MQAADLAKYPPRNLALNSLSPLYRQVEHEHGVLDLTASEMERACNTTALHGKSPVPELKSFLSGKPACLYRTNEVEIALTTQEICRLQSGKLTEEELLKLAEHYGAFYALDRSLR